MFHKDKVWLVDRAGLGAMIGGSAPLVADVGSATRMAVASLFGALLVVGIAYAFRLHESGRRRP